MASRKMTKKEKRRFLLLGSTAIITIILLVSSFISNWYQIYSKSKDKEFLEKQLIILEEQEYELSKEVERLQDPNYVARYAREKYLYSRDGEILIKIK